MGHHAMLTLFVMPSNTLYKEIGHAIKALESGNFNLAEKKLENLFRKNKQSYEVMEVLSAVYLAQNKKKLAIDLLRQLVIKNPHSISTLFNLAKALEDGKDYEEASKYYLQLLDLEPNHIDGLLNYSKCSIEINDLNKAINIITKILEIVPNHKPALINMGVIFKKRGDYEQAINYANRVLEQDPGVAEVYSNKGGALYSLKRYAESIIEFNKALEIRPNFIEAILNKANALLALGNHQDAIIEFDRLLALKPYEIDALNCKGNCLNEIGEHQAAIIEFEKSLRINQNSDIALAGMGGALIELGNYEAGLIALKKALIINPTLEVAKLNQFIAYVYQKNHSEISRLYSGLNQTNKENSEFLFRYSLYCLEQKKFTEGWPLYEKRFDTKGYETVLPKTIPMWQLKDHSSSLLIIGDQGIGDQILFSSLLSELNNSIKKTLLINHKLKTIYQRSFPGITVLDKITSTEEKNFDGYIHLSSLGKFLRPDIQAFKNSNHSFLVDNKNLTQVIKNKIKFNTKLVCGISWKSTNLKLGGKKDLSLEQLLPIFNLNISFINLQYGEVEKEINNLKENYNISIKSVEGINLYENIDAALSIIQACDFIITSSNATAHLAGALGKETLLLVPYSRGRLWYWSDCENKCLWYPSIKIFEQHFDGEWKIPLTNIKNYIQKNWSIK